MAIYFIILFFSFFPLVFLNRNKFAYYLSLSFLVLFAGLRSLRVGTDSGNYANMLQSPKVKNADFLSNIGTLEFGYSLLLKLTSLLSSKYSVLFISIALIVVVSYFITIKKLSFDLSTSIFIYITLGIYLFFFNGARQGIAAAIYGFAIIELIKGNFKKYLFWVLIASLFHKSVLITIPFYFIIRTKFSILKFFFLLIISFIVIYSLNDIIVLFPQEYTERYYNYIDRNKTGAFLLTIFYSLLLIIFIYFRKFVSKSKLFYYDIYLNMASITSVIYLVVVIAKKDVNLVRLTLYFALGYILIWPIILKDVKLFQNPATRLLFYLTHLIFFYIFINKMSNLVPYYFNPNIL